MKKNDTWVKKRHAIVRNIACFLIAPYARIKYGISIEKCDALKNRQCLILLNHQTPFDQFFVGISIPGPVYYIASEDIFSNGWISSLLRWLVAPISIKKQTTDIGAIKNCIRVAREGGTIAMAPEGNRTYSGKTEYINPSVAALAKKLNLPIVLYRIEGGYGVQPRWSDVIRKGTMRAYVSRIIEPEAYSDLSKEALYAMIQEGLYVDDTTCGRSFRHGRRAEYLERAMYVCPFCGLSSFHSQGQVVECNGCHRQVAYGASLELKGVGFDFPFQYTTQWYDYQKQYVSGLDLNAYIQAPAYRDQANVFQVVLNKRKKLLQKDADVALYGDRILLGDTVLPFDACSGVTVLGRNKLNIYHGETVYQLKGSKRFNALKYVNFYYCHKNITKEGTYGKFLGL